MKRILGWLCIASILMMSMVAGSTVTFAATTSTATVTDVYASGNWVVGQTVTAHFTYYDPTGKPQVGDAAIQWYRTGNTVTADTAISGATSANYTLTEADASAWLYFTVTTSNADGAGKVFYSPIYESPKVQNDSATAPTRIKGHMVLTGGATAYVPGATVRATHQTAFTNLKAEGATTYAWRLYDTLADFKAGKYTVASSEQTYTIKEEDYGKYLGVVITPKDADGNSNSSYWVDKVKIGAKFDLNSVLTINGNPFYNKANLINRLWYQPQNNIYTYGATIDIVVDAQKSVKFDGVHFASSRVGTDFAISYSNDNATWTPLSSATLTAASDVADEYTSPTVLTARYFRLVYTATNVSTLATANATLTAFYPYLSAANRSAEYVDITSVDNGAEVDNGALTISNITYGMPLATLVDSVVAANNESVVSVTDASGAAVANASDIKLTPANIADYRIKVAYGDRSQSYTLALADALFTNDFSGMVEGTEYRALTGYTRDIPGGVTYWHAPGTDATVDNTSYGIRESLGDGKYAMKVLNNGAIAEDGAVVNFWTTVQNLDPTGTYSFKFRVKSDDNTDMAVHGRAGSRSSSFFDRQSIRIKSTDGISTSNGAGHTRYAGCEQNQWYDVEWVIDYNDNSQSMWINGVNYGMDVPFTINGTNIDKTQISLCIAFYDAVGGTYDESYISDLVCTKVWDVTTKVSADGEPLGMKLYSGDTVEDSLTMGGTYTAKGNGNVFSDEYYVAVYKVEYADDATMTETGRSLINAFCVDGSGTAQIDGINIPASAYAQYDSGNVKSKAVVKIFCLNDGLKPARDFVQID